MAWETVSLTSPKAAKEQGFISISSGKITFSYKFLNNNDLLSSKYVRIFVDQDEFKIAFQFLKDRQDDNCMTLGFRSRGKPSARIGMEALRKFQFIKEIESFESSRDRRFIASSETGQFGKVWVISGAPGFKKAVSRSDLASIPSEASGVYRYLKKGEIVYIGKGQIRRRAQEAQRSEWDFDIIQYSVIEKSSKELQEKEQYRWERHWIQRYKEEKGDRPKYNKTDGNAVD